METITKELVKKAEALLELTNRNEQAISGRILPIGMQVFKAQKLNTDQAKELGAIMLALLTIWKSKAQS